MKASKRKVQIARARAGMTILDIAEKAGLPRITVSRAANGISVSPTNFGKIARALGVDVTEIVEDEQEE